MKTARISSKGRIVIPKVLRDLHQIRTGDRFIIASVGDELRLRPAPVIEPVGLRDVAGMLHHAMTRAPGETETEARIGGQLLAEVIATKSQ